MTASHNTISTLLSMPTLIFAQCAPTRVHEALYIEKTTTSPFEVHRSSPSGTTYAGRTSRPTYRNRSAHFRVEAYSLRRMIVLLSQSNPVRVSLRCVVVFFLPCTIWPSVDICISPWNYGTAETEKGYVERLNVIQCCVPEL